MISTTLSKRLLLVGETISIEDWPFIDSNSQIDETDTMPLIGNTFLRNSAPYQAGDFLAKIIF